MKFKILSDSSCDLPDALIEKNQIDIVPFYVSFDQENYFKEKEEIKIDEFYSKLYDAFPKTSLPSVHDYLNKFENYAKAGDDLLCINLTSKFSGSHQSAVNAKEIIKENNPDMNIAVLDSQLCTAVQGLLVLEAVKMRDAGFTLEETVERLKQIIPSGRIMFTISTLEYLQKGGRIGKASALAGNILNLNPLIVVKDGELFPYGTVRGRKKALKKIVEMTVNHFKETGEDVNDYEFCIAIGDCMDEAIPIKEKIEDELKIDISLPYFTPGSTIATNTGPDPIGIVFLKKHDKV